MGAIVGAIVSEDLSINAERLAEALEALGAIGAYTDEPTGLIGVRRLALSDEDQAARELVVEHPPLYLAHPNSTEVCIQSTHKRPASAWTMGSRRSLRTVPATNSTE